MNPRHVRALRKLRRLSNRDLAELAGISASTASRVEQGRPVRSTTARAVARALGEGPSKALGRVIRA